MKCLNMMTSRQMKELLKLAGFCLLIMGTLGLLITELVIDQGRPYTLTFAAINAVGLATLAIAHWVIRSK